MAYACLRFPAIDGNNYQWGRLTRDGSGLIQVQLNSRLGTDSLESFGSSADTLEFMALRFSPSKAFPLVGGVSRGFVAVSRSGADPRMGTVFSPSYPWSGANDDYFEVYGELETTDIFYGTTLSIFFDGNTLTFR